MFDPEVVQGWADRGRARSIMDIAPGPHAFWKTCKPFIRIDRSSFPIRDWFSGPGVAGRAGDPSLRLSRRVQYRFQFGNLFFVLNQVEREFLDLREELRLHLSEADAFLCDFRSGGNAGE